MTYVVGKTSQCVHVVHVFMRQDNKFIIVSCSCFQGTRTSAGGVMTWVCVTDKYTMVKKKILIKSVQGCNNTKNGKIHCILQLMFVLLLGVFKHFNGQFYY